MDTLKADRFKAITSSKLDKVLAGLMAAKEAGFSPIKINIIVTTHATLDYSIYVYDWRLIKTSTALFH